MGSNGLTQHGMYHEDEALPDFVHGFGEILSESSPLPPPADRPCRPHSKLCFSLETLNSNPITQKMETPVIYFYSDRQQEVEVNVKFPLGVITETYPAPIRTFPRTEGRLENGDTTFRVSVTGSRYDKLPYVDPTNIYAHARNVVEASSVRAGSFDNPEVEKFIFYRGLGRFQPRLQISSTGDSLTFRAPNDARPQAAFLVYSDGEGKVRTYDVGSFGTFPMIDIEADTIRYLKTGVFQGFGRPRLLNSQETRAALIGSLKTAGLTDDEAVAMINTWEHGYLGVRGLRLLYILPRNEVEATLPLSISPAPEKLERVFIGRLEIMTEADEIRVFDRVMNEGQLGFDVSSLGRFAHPTLIRTKQAYIERQARTGTTIDQKIIHIFDTLIEKASIGIVDGGVVR
ncbi:MAG TPA: hypothetical protein VM432_11400 [Bdellovibrionales bacterium]|nr:hypothetical protein [Bdellovibrionales bacterium]